MIETNVSKQRETFLQILLSYFQLTKPRIIPLLLITTAGSMWIAAKGQVDPILLLATLTGGTLAAASAQAINCVYDRDIDWEMERTRHRPIPSGRIHSRDALIFAFAMAVAAFAILSIFANLLAALLAMCGIGFYVLIYTHFLKRHSSQNIVIGGAAGAIPTLVGWTAVTGHLSLTAWLLFSIVFLWTPPHFWSLALLIKDDYAKVGVPMLPVIAGNQETARQIWYYTLLTVAATLLLVYPLRQSGTVYAAIAIYLGGVFIHKAWQLLQNPQERNLARGLFLFSISYMMLLCLGMVVDSLPVIHNASNFVITQLHLLN
jgi:protoheme IX farnesyltransferase